MAYFYADLLSKENRWSKVGNTHKGLTSSRIGKGEARHLKD